MTRSNRKKIAGSLSHFSAGSNVDTYIGGLTADGEEAGRIIQVPLRELVGAAWQPRILDDADSMKHLMESIARDGVLHPLTVRPLQPVHGTTKAHRYEVVAGHRRLDALRRLACGAGTGDTATAPVIIRDLTNLEARLLTHAENAARKNLEAWEKAREIASVRDALAAAGAPHDVDSVGVKLGRSGGGASEYLRIADLITVDALIAAGACDADGALDATVVRAMTRAQLLAVVKKGEQARPGALRALVARTRSAPRGRHQRVGGRGGSPDTSQADPDPRYSASYLRESGGFRMNLSRPFARYSADEARRYLTMMGPAVIALLEQLGGTDAVYRIPAGSGTLLYVPQPVEGTSVQEFHAAVLSALGAGEHQRG